MRYISDVTGKSEKVTRVKEQILQSNPLLESFGNAKTGNIFPRKLRLTTPPCSTKQ